MADNSNIFTTARLTDEKIVEIFQAVHAAFPVQSGRFNLGGPVTVDFGNEELINGLLKQRHAIKSASFNLNSNVTIEFQRGTSVEGSAFGIRKPSPYYDEFSLTPHSGNKDRKQIPANDFIELTELFENLLPPVYVGDGLVESTDVITVLRAELTSQAEQLRGMIRDVNQERIRANQEIEKERQIFYAEQNSARERLEEDNRQKIIEAEEKISTQRERLESEREELTKIRQNLDDRDHTHVRRELREIMNKSAESEIIDTALPPRARFLSTVIITISLVVAGVLFYFSYNSFAAYERSAPNMHEFNSADLFFVLRGFLASLGGLGFVIYAINWMRKIYTEDVSTQRTIKQHIFDLNRASWAIETIMDIGKTEGRLPPETWISGVCRNLFDVTPGVDNRKTVSSQALAAVLNSASRVKVGPDGTEVELGSRGARSIAKKMADEN